VAPQKRGPKSQELRELIERLQAENILQREKLQHLEGLLARDAALNNNNNNNNNTSNHQKSTTDLDDSTSEYHSPSSTTSSSSSPSLANELTSLTVAHESRGLLLNRHVYHLGLLNQYLDTYLEFVHPHMQMTSTLPFSGPNRSNLLSIVYSPQPTTLSKTAYVQMNIMLALGARYATPRVRLLVVGCWLLVVGCWLLVVGCWLLVVGCWLVVGC
jgi:hypothetical protein